MGVTPCHDGSSVFCYGCRPRTREGLCSFIIKRTDGNVKKNGSRPGILRFPARFASGAAVCLVDVDLLLHPDILYAGVGAGEDIDPVLHPAFPARGGDLRPSEFRAFPFVEQRRRQGSGFLLRPGDGGGFEQLVPVADEADGSALP